MSNLIQSIKLNINELLRKNQQNITEDIKTLKEIINIQINSLKIDTTKCRLKYEDQVRRKDDPSNTGTVMGFEICETDISSYYVNIDSNGNIQKMKENDLERIGNLLARPKQIFSEPKFASDNEILEEFKEKLRNNILKFKDMGLTLDDSYLDFDSPEISRKLLERFREKNINSFRLLDFKFRSGRDPIKVSVTDPLIDINSYNKSDFGVDSSDQIFVFRMPMSLTSDGNKQFLILDIFNIDAPVLFSGGVKYNLEFQVLVVKENKLITRQVESAALSAISASSSPRSATSSATFSMNLSPRSASSPTSDFSAATAALGAQAPRRRITLSPTSEAFSPSAKPSALSPTSAASATEFDPFAPTKPGSLGKDEF